MRILGRNSHRELDVVEEDVEDLAPLFPSMGHVPQYFTIIHAKRLTEKTYEDIERLL